MKDKKVIDVLVVGAGPTGTSLAIDLARRGLDIRVVDKAVAGFGGSRAKGIQPRTLEIFHDLDVIDDILGGGSDYPLLGIHFGPFVIPWRMMSSRRRTAEVPFPNTWLIPQFRVDRALHRRLERLGRRIDFERELIELRQDSDLVTAKISGPDGIEEIEARYLVGGDGGSSTVRRKLGINFGGSTDEEDRMIVLDAVTHGLSRDRWHIWPGPAGRFVGACPLPHSDLFQWMIRLNEGEPPDLVEAVLRNRIQARIRDRRVQIEDVHWKSIFRPNIRLVERYRCGRIFLAGDAAHVHTPAGAQGLNTGVQDAYNLGWKLGQVLAGADTRLLDSYEAERLPIAAAVLALSTRKYNGIAKLDPSSIRRGKDETQLALTYRDGPLATRDAAPTTTLRAGDRAPGADLIDDARGQVHLFDVYRGPHFTAIAYGPRAALALDRLQWPSDGAPLKRITIDVTVTGTAGGAFTDSGHSFRRAYGLSGDTLLLVRPDGYIGHIATDGMLESTQAVMRTVTPAAGISDLPTNNNLMPAMGVHK